jgi:ribosome-associated protein
VGGRLKISFQSLERSIIIMQTIKLRDDFIKLGQALKAAGLVDSGVDAKFVIQDGLVKVNHEVEYQRGKKLVDGDIVEYNGEQIKIEK